MPAGTIDPSKVALARLERVVTLLVRLENLDDGYVPERDGWTGEARQVWLGELDDLRLEIAEGGGPKVDHHARHLARELDHWGVTVFPREASEPFRQIADAFSDLQRSLKPLAKDGQAP
jgi:hypothetical protein